MKFYKFILFLLILPLAVCSQNEIYQGIKKLQLSDSEKAIKIDSLLQKNLYDGDIDNLVIVSNKFANWHFNRKRVAKAIAALSISIKYHNQDVESLQSKLYKRGYWHSLLSNYDASIKDFKHLVTLDSTTKWHAHGYFQIAENLYNKGDFPLSAMNYEIAEGLFLSKKQYNDLISLYTSSYNTYSKIRTPEASNKLLSNLQAADSLSHLYNVNPDTNYIVNRTLGIYYNNYQTRDINKGKVYLNRALEIAYNLQDSARIAYVYNDIGRLYDEVNPEKSISYNKQALQYTPVQDRATKLISEANLALNNAHLGNYEESISKLQLVLHYMTGHSFDKKSSNKKKELIVQNLKDNNLWSIIRWLGEVYDLKHEKTGDSKDLDSAITYYKLTDFTFDQYASQSRLTNSKLLWRKEASELYSRGLRAFAKAGKNSDIIYFTEKNKALLLTSETEKIKSLREQNLSTHLIEQERKLQLRIKNITNNGRMKDLPALIDSLEYVQNKLRKLIPEIDSLEGQTKILSLQSIQENLKIDEAILEYHISTDDTYGIFPNPNVGYGMLIVKDSTLIFELDNLSSIRSLSQSFLGALKKPQGTQQELEAYTKTSHELYNILIPEDITPLIQDKKLTIIPDNFLSQIPFEALVINTAIPNDYLINHREINYKYSNTFHQSQSKNRKTLSAEYSAFAPIEFKNKELSTLYNSGQEIEILQNYFKGTDFAQEQATKATFLSQLENGGIIHLATHANATDSINPWISFYDEKVTLDELYNYQNDASLVVLSACNTNTGQIITGEGTMSLARGFFYGGAQSTVSSLWQIDDKATTTLMQSFYKYLAEGESKSKALRNAKLEYLKNHSGSEASPYYWSSFILIGDISPLPSANYSWWHYIVFGIIILVGLFLLSRKRKTSNSNL